MLIKLILVAFAVIVIGTIIYLFMNSKAEADPDPREGKPENDLQKPRTSRPFANICWNAQTSLITRKAYSC